ncbi:MAG: ATP-binding protein [Actinomycetota bacterium]|nr:ATP-binding protein [Actinomycetota bacterium]
MRAFVADFLRQMDVPEDIADEVLMAVGEVVANACRHGRRPTRPGNVQVSCEIADSVVCIEVADVGPGFNVDAILGGGIPDLMSPGGRGFFLMQQLTDDVNVRSSRGGTTVVLQRQLPAD